MIRRRWRTVAASMLVLAWVGWVTWLLASPPTIKEAVPERYHLACQPIGRDITDVSMLGAMSDEEEEFIDWYAQNRVFGSSDLDWTRNRLLTEVTAACSEARTNRLVSLMLVVAGGLTLIVLRAVAVVARRLPKIGADKS